MEYSSNPTGDRSDHESVVEIRVLTPHERARENALKAARIAAAQRARAADNVDCGWAHVAAYRHWRARNV
jgi:hypothetical protein